MTKLLYFSDVHVGFEKRGGRLKPLHDEKAFGALLGFASDFKPDILIAGGDILDCGAVSHHKGNKVRLTEGMRLFKDAELCQAAVIKPMEQTVAKGGKKIMGAGNHEDWIEQFLDEHPELEGTFSLRSLLGLDHTWDVLEQGWELPVGPHLTFMHGDQLKGGQHIASKAVTDYGTNVVFGHFHTSQTWTKTSPISNVLPKTGTAVGCLCHKDPAYNKSAPNKWSQGFYFAYMEKDGTFTAYSPVIINGRFAANGKSYRG